MEHGLNIETGPAAALPPSGWRGGVASLARALEPMIAIPAALLVVAEIVVLLQGIVARYVLHSPVVWSDELAGILFLWLAMLGSVIAFQRGEHMRMTAIVSRLSSNARSLLDVVAVAASLAFLLLVIHPAYEFAVDEVFVTTPALGIANSWRAAALPVGIGLMLIVAALRLAAVADAKHQVAAVVIVGAIATILAQGRGLGSPPRYHKRGFHWDVSTTSFERPCDVCFAKHRFC